MKPAHLLLAAVFCILAAASGAVLLTRAPEPPDIPEVPSLDSEAIPQPSVAPRLGIVDIRFAPAPGYAVAYSLDRPEDPGQPIVLQSGITALLEGRYRFRASWPAPDVKDRYGEFEVKPGEFGVIEFQAEPGAPPLPEPEGIET